MDAKRILVADSEAWVRKLYASELVRDGHQVSTAANEEEVLRALGQERPDLALIDLRLPPRGGLEVLNEVLSLPAAPAVLLTSWCDFWDEGYLIWMADGCFVKSRGVLELKEAIREALERRAARAAGPASTEASGPRRD